MFSIAVIFGADAPLNNPTIWIAPKGYPLALATKGASGTVGFRLAVASSGKPVACVIKKARGS